jgi:hypothetical protein
MSTLVRTHTHMTIGDVASTTNVRSRDRGPGTPQRRHGTQYRLMVLAICKACSKFNSMIGTLYRMNVADMSHTEYKVQSTSSRQLINEHRMRLGKGWSRVEDSISDSVPLATSYPVSPQAHAPGPTQQWTNSHSPGHPFAWHQRCQHTRGCVARQH